MTKTLILLVACVASLAFFADGANAKTVKLTQTVSKDQLHSACDAAGGEYSESESGGHYVCLSPASDTECNAKGKCTAVLWK